MRRILDRTGQQMPIDMFAKKVSNPVSRKRSHQQILQEEDEFDNSPWNDEHDGAPARGSNAGSARAAAKMRGAVSKVGRAVTTKAKPVGVRGKGKTKLLEDDPIELDDETDIEEILDDDDDVPLAVSMAKKTTTRKEVGLGARGKIAPMKAFAKSIEAPWATFKATGQSTTGRGRVTTKRDEMEEITSARQENATPCERLYDSLQAVYQGVSQPRARKVEC